MKPNEYVCPGCVLCRADRELALRDAATQLWDALEAAVLLPCPVCLVVEDILAPHKNRGESLQRTAERVDSMLSASEARCERMRGAIDGLIATRVLKHDRCWFRCEECRHVWTRPEYAPLEQEHHADDCVVGKARAALSAEAAESRQARELRLRDAGYDQRPIEEQLAARNLAPIAAAIGAVASSLPTSAEDERIVDAVMARREVKTKPMTPVAAAGEYVEHLQARLASQQAELEKLRENMHRQCARAETAEAELARVREQLRALTDNRQ